MVELYYYCYINLHCGCIDRFISPFLSRIAKLKLTRMTTIIRSEEQKKVIDWQTCKVIYRANISLVTKKRERRTSD